MHAVVFVDEDDVARYTIKTIDDPRTLNKTVYLRPPDNILSQRQLVEKWENLSGKQLHKSSLSEHDLLSSMKGKLNMHVPNIFIHAHTHTHNLDGFITICVLYIPTRLNLAKRANPL